jgi:antitoxin component YwqK of YwqJK toxin-antitoxin module
MRKLILLIAATTIFIAAQAQKTAKLEDLDKKGKLYYHNTQLYNGTAISTFDNGQVGAKGVFKNGDRDGLWEWWYSTGQKKRETTYKDGKKEGMTIYWHLNGVKSKEIMYRNDKNIDQKLWDENGNRLPNPSFQQSY